jgi:hypothetical protein
LRRYELNNLHRQCSFVKSALSVVCAAFQSRRPLVIARFDLWLAARRDARAAVISPALLERLPKSPPRQLIAPLGVARSGYYAWLKAAIARIKCADRPPTLFGNYADHL